MCVMAVVGVSDGGGRKRWRFHGVWSYFVLVSSLPCKKPYSTQIYRVARRPQQRSIKTIKEIPLLSLRLLKVQVAS